MDGFFHGQSKDLGKPKLSPKSDGSSPPRKDNERPFCNAILSQTFRFGISLVGPNLLEDLIR